MEAFRGVPHVPKPLPRNWPSLASRAPIATDCVDCGLEDCGLELVTLRFRDFEPPRGLWGPISR
eukprot:7813583-Alexandrium_andersonii.AAC.1